MLTILYDIATLINGLFKVQITVDLLRSQWSRWGWAAISTMLTILASIIILMNPFTSSLVLWTFIAITLIVEAIRYSISYCCWWERSGFAYAQGEDNDNHSHGHPDSVCIPIHAALPDQGHHDRSRQGLKGFFNP